VEEHVPIRIREGTPPTDDLWRVFDTTGWNDEYRLSAAELKTAFESSWFVVGAYADDRLVGVGRVASDTVVHAMIYDLIVIPERQGTGIGEQLLARLVERCTNARIRDIQLFCARGKRSFYEKRGFVARPEDAPGMQYARQASAPEQTSSTPGQERGRPTTRCS
jgi:GNAT superfamily N-acetyltransferase